MNKITTTDLRNFDCLFISSEWNIDDEGHTEFRNEIFVVEPSQYDDWYNLLRYNLNTTKTPLMLNKQWIELQRKNFYGHMKIMCREMRLSAIAKFLTEDIYASMRRKTTVTGKLSPKYCVRVVVYMYNSHNNNQKITVFDRKKIFKEEYQSLKSSPMKSTRKQQKDGKKMYSQYKGMVGDVKQMGKQFSKNFKKLI